MKINVGFAFTRRNISCRTLYGLNGIDKRVLLFGEKSINNFIAKITAEQPKRILGMGIYSGRDKNNIRIESITCNRFRISKINENLMMPTVNINQKGFEELSMNPFISPSENLILAKSIGISWCNLVSWKIMELISTGTLKSEYTFLHIPKRFKLESAVEIIQKSLD